jgi:hypothetical protein
MEKVRGKVITIMLATSTAATTALSLAYIAHYDFGLSRQEIRTPAVVGAGVISVLVAVEYFGKKLRKLNWAKLAAYARNISATTAARHTSGTPALTVSMITDGRSDLNMTGSVILKGTFGQAQIEGCCWSKIRQLGYDQRIEPPGL